jgi:hypothetical protein
MYILYVKSCTFVKSLLKRIRIYIFISQISKQLFNIMSFRISNFRAIDSKVAELCVVEKCVFSAVLVGFRLYATKAAAKSNLTNISEPKIRI